MQNDWWSGLSYMYRGRSWSYNEVSQYVPWRQTGWVEVYVYWYLNLAVDGCGWAVCPDHFMATGKALVFIELEAEWALELAWIFWRKDSSLAASKIWTPNLLAYILVIVLTMLPLTDLKVIQKSILINWDRMLGLDVFDLWQEFLEIFSEHSDFRT